MLIDPADEVHRRRLLVERADYCTKASRDLSGSSLFPEGVLDPFKFFAVAVQQHGVEAARRKLFSDGHVVPGRAQQSFALGGGNAFGRTTKRFVAPVADFDKDQRAPVTHDQIDLAEATTVVAFQ